MKNPFQQYNFHSRPCSTFTVHAPDRLTSNTPPSPFPPLCYILSSTGLPYLHRYVRLPYSFSPLPSIEAVYLL